MPGFQELMNTMSESELLDYLDNSTKYTPEAMTAAVNELKRRGRKFTDEELIVVKKRIQTSEEIEKEEDDPWNRTSWKKNVVTDNNASLLYSPGAIQGFSIIFSVFFGAFLLSSNIKDRKKRLIVIGFGIIYTAITITIVKFIPGYYLLLLNTAGGLGLTTTFWDKYIGKETKYRTRSIWKPLIISIFISAILVITLLHG
ncbi:MAG: hypothetical protein JST75_08125 [Bacteroidetes bacterium]|nr:hypothetical protein [Bacteroidota bacterium]